jgi:hypothetical protein
MKHVFSGDHQAADHFENEDLLVKTVGGVQQATKPVQGVGIDKRAAIEIMSNTCNIKLGYTFQQLHRKVQFEIERMVAMKRREENKERISNMLITNTD